MDKNQSKGNTVEAKGKSQEVASKVSGDKSTESKGEGEKHVGKGGAVLGDVNDDARKDGAESEDINDDAQKHGSKHDTVLGDINDDAKKKPK